MKRGKEQGNVKRSLNIEHRAESRTSVINPESAFKHNKRVNVVAHVHAYIYTNAVYINMYTFSRFLQISQSTNSVEFLMF